MVIFIKIYTQSISTLLIVHVLVDGVFAKFDPKAVTAFWDATCPFSNESEKKRAIVTRCTTYYNV